MMNDDVLRLRALSQARGRGVLVAVGLETRTQAKLVEEGHLYQEIASGRRYKFTLSKSGQRLLDAAEEK
jgi:hypothetical protein